MVHDAERQAAGTPGEGSRAAAVPATMTVPATMAVPAAVTANGGAADLVLDDFFTRAIVGGVGVALTTCPLGCFIVWRRMAYFGDTMSHSALLGVALGFALGVAPTAGVVVVTVAVAMVLVAVQKAFWLSSDTALGILAHSALAMGLIALSLMTTLRVDLMGYLFGDILALTATDLGWIYSSGTLILLVLALVWRPLLATTVHQDLACAEGIPTFAVGLIFMLLIAVVIAFAMKIVGVLLITSLLIIPAATGRRFARSPEQMALLAALFGVAAVILGLLTSLRLDTPSGPSIVAAAAVLFALVMLIPVVRKRRPPRVS